MGSKFGAGTHTLFGGAAAVPRAGGAAGAMGNWRRGQAAGCAIAAGSALRINAKEWSLKALPIDLRGNPMKIAMLTLKNRSISPVVQLSWSICGRSRNQCLHHAKDESFVLARSERDPLRRPKRTPFENFW